MADFVAVLNKTLDGLKDPSAEMREKVYAKARATIAAKLAAIDPPPPQAAIDRQNQALEAAIQEVEATYLATEVELDSEAMDALLADDIFAPPPPPKPDSAPPASLAPQPEQTRPEPSSRSSQPASSRRDPMFDELEDDYGTDDDSLEWDADEDELEDGAPVKRRRGKGLVGALLAILVVLMLGGAGYAVWLNKEPLLELVGLGDMPDRPAASAGSPAGSETEEIAAIGEDAEPGAEADPAGQEETRKFTQRLMADGSEVDPGPATDEPMTGEGTSVASSSRLEGETVPASPEAPAAGPAASQKAIFYEERTSSAQGSAEPGQVSWRLVEESPGGGLPPEPAIRGEATIPGKNLQFRMTIRRNGDESLPASHIIEMIFIVPEDFDGGAIDNVLRVAFKESEQSPGNPLLGIPAKISDGFFLLALSDSNAEIQANNMMMRRLDWLDIPIVYRSGRRALITLEKGAAGAKVFEDALKAWAPQAAGTEPQ